MLPASEFEQKQLIAQVRTAAGLQLDRILEQLLNRGEYQEILDLIHPVDDSGARLPVKETACELKTLQLVFKLLFLATESASKKLMIELLIQADQLIPLHIIQSFSPENAWLCELRELEELIDKLTQQIKENSEGNSLEFILYETWDLYTAKTRLYEGKEADSLMAKYLLFPDLCYIFA